MSHTKTKNDSAYATFKESLGIANPMQAPKLSKVVVSVGTGSVKDKNKIKLIADRLAKITGQKPASKVAKMSIATFKLREGEAIGYQVTLRGKRMYDFLDRLLNVALPRQKTFVVFHQQQ